MGEIEKDSYQIEPKKVEKVISGNAKLKKKSFFSRLVQTFVPSSEGDLGTFIFKDLLEPVLKKGLYEIVTNGANTVRDLLVDGVDILLYKEVRRNKGTPTSRISYNNYYDNRGRYPNNQHRSSIRAPQSNYYFDDIVVSTRGEAESILYTMEELISRYGVVSIADLYDIAGITAGPFTNNSYGWNNLASASAVPVSDGYLIKLPRAIPLD